MTSIYDDPEIVPVPQPGELTAPFWSACRERKLIYQRCTACGLANFDPVFSCRRCMSRALEWQPSLGLGDVYSWTVIWRAPSPAFRVPYVAAVVRLDEGYYMFANIIGCDVSDVHEQMRVEVDFLHVRDEIWIPCFRPLPNPDVALHVACSCRGDGKRPRRGASLRRGDGVSRTPVRGPDLGRRALPCACATSAVVRDARGHGVRAGLPADAHRRRAGGFRAFGPVALIRRR
jgi:hypothetical protein